MNLEPTSNHIKSIRDQHECGIFEAKAIAQKEVLLEAIDSATSIEEIKEILTRLVNHVKIT